MKDTKARIQQTALDLFSRRGYEAVSVSDIAGALGMTKGALYRHFKSKQAIFESILRAMEEADARQARSFELPEEGADADPAAYEGAAPERILSFSLAMFRHWTEDPFAAAFRRLLTLEQYRSPQMGRLYRQYLSEGPMNYVADLLGGLGLPDPLGRAAAFYGPMFLLYSVYDGSEDKKAVTALLADTLKKEMKDLMGGKV